MSFVSKSKNTLPSDKIYAIPQPDPISTPLQNVRTEQPCKQGKLEQSQSIRKLDQLRQQCLQKSEQTSSKSKFNVTPPKNAEFRMVQADRCQEPCFGYAPNQTQSPSISSNSNQPSTQICGKPTLKSGDEGLRIEITQMKGVINEQNKLVESLQQKLDESHREINQFEQDNKKLKDNMMRLSNENQQLYQQIDEMIKDIEYIRQGQDKKDQDCQELQKQNQSLLQQIRSEQNVNQLQSELNEKDQEITELQDTIQEYLVQLQVKDKDYQQLVLQFEQFKHENQQKVKNQQYNQLAQKESTLTSRRESSQSELIYYQAQLEQKEKEKQICEDKLVEMQTTINILSEKKNNQNHNSSFSQREVMKLKQLISVQKRQIESQQKTIMNQHYEIQNLQTLLYSSNDSQLIKSYQSNDYDLNSLSTQKQEELFHIKDTQPDLRIKISYDENSSPQQKFQKCAVAYVQEDTFRKLDREPKEDNF